MGLFHSPKIVTDSLYIYLDAANPRSYPGSGTDWFDVSGNGNHGVFGNSPSYNSGESFTFPTSGGSGDYVTVSSLDCDKNYYSVEWWMNINSVGNYYPWLSFNDSWNYWVFHATNLAEVYVGTDVGTRMTPTQLPTGTLEVGLWKQYAYTFDNGTGYFYKNGKLVNSKGSMTITTNTLSEFKIGGSTYTMSGKVASVKVYNGKALTAEEIDQNFNAHRGRYGL